MRLTSASNLAKFDNAIRLLNNHLVLQCKSESTKKTYVKAVKRFMFDVQQLPEESSYEEITTYLMKCKVVLQKGFATIKSYIFALRYYLKHVCDREDILVRIPNPKMKKYDIQVLSVDELKRLFESCRDSRQLIVVHMLFETGVRISELAKLQLSDFDFVNRTITIRRSKNDVTRTVHFGDTLAETMKTYLDEFKSLFSGHLFFKQYHPFMPLSKRGISWILNSIVKRSNIQKRVTPHSLRHAFAVHYLNFGGTIFQLQRLLGHSRLQSTMNYLQYASIHEGCKISPLDRLSSLDQFGLINVNEC